ncbi:MAG: acetylornithine deacetylase [Pyrinomonadaceae bacterium]
MTVKETLAKLVSIDSVSSRSNAEIVAYLAERCEAAGLKVRRFPYTDESGIEKLNLVAQTSPGDSTNQTSTLDSENCATVELALVGHTDTVPYDPAWPEATTLTERDGKLYGRGACDTKAFIAAALTAVESFDLKEMTQPLALVFTADEEVGCLGAKRLAAARPFRARYAIVGEPTSLQPMRAGKGYSLAEITVHGREAHSAYPAIGESANFRAAHLITAIEAIAQNLQEDRQDGFDPPYTSLNIGILKGGTAKNIIAGECYFTLEWRPIPNQRSDHVLDRVRSAIEELRTRDPGFRCEINAARADESFETTADSRLVQLLEKTSGRQSGAVAFGTEAPQMISLGAEAVVFGPGDIRVAHRTGEFVPVDQLENCVQILRSALTKLCT